MVPRVTDPSAAAPSFSTPSFRRVLLPAAVFLVALFASAWLLGQRLPFPSVPAIGERFQFFAENRDHYDTIFIGSSRFRHQIIPEEYDAHTKAGGIATRAINLGYSGMWPPESFYFVRQLLALKPAQLKWVVIELMDYRYGQVDVEKPTQRTAYWHDREHTALALRLMWELPLPTARRVELCVTHAWLGVRQFMHPGQGADWLQARLMPVKKKSKLPRWARQGGYESQEEVEPWSEGAKASYARQVEAVRASLSPQTLRPGFAVALREIIGEVRRAGAEPIFVIAPTIRPEENLVTGVPEDVTVFAFNRPDDYPILYEHTTHYDPGHLNEKGAREFTRLLAERFVQQVRPR